MLRGDVREPMPVSAETPVSRALLSTLAALWMLLSSGRTIYEVARFELPKLPGIIVVPDEIGRRPPKPANGCLVCDSCQLRSRHR